jgi:ubiquitin-activating enzyme E1
MGVASLTIRDPNPVQIADLSSQVCCCNFWKKKDCANRNTQFFFSESDVGQNRAQVSLPKLTEMNERVELSVHNDELTEQFLKGFTVRMRSFSSLFGLALFCLSGTIHAQNFAALSY